MNRPVMRWEQHTLQIPANSTAGQFNFGDIPQLRSDVTQDIAVRAIEFYTADTFPLDPLGVALPTLAQLQQCFLTLYVNSEESIFRVPLIKMVNVYQNGVNPSLWENSVMDYSNILVDWTKSYISTPTPFNNAAIIAFSFGVTYLRLPPGTIKGLQQVQETKFDSPRLL